MGESSRSKRAEMREFWEEAVRLWGESGLSVREFCTREGLALHAFYSRRRELQQERMASETRQDSLAAEGNESRMETRRAERRPAAVDAMPEGVIATPFVELVASPSATLCQCTLELENASGAKMRIRLRSTAMPDLAAVSQSFWNQCG
jgi:transposase-like protein